MTLRRAFALVSLAALAAVFTAGSFLTYLAVRDSIGVSRIETDKALSVSVTALLIEPLRLGSFVEARNRIMRLQESGAFACSEMMMQETPITSCDRDKTSLRVVEIEIPVFDNSEKPKLKLYLDEGHQLQRAVRKGLQVGVYLLLFGVLIAFAVLLIARSLFRQLESVLTLAVPGGSKNQKTSRIREFNQLREKLFQLVRLQQSEARLQAFSEIAQQVAHDILSPLLALRVAAKHFDSNPKESQALIEKAALRINKMAEDLLIKNRHRPAEYISQDHSLLQSLESVVKEMRFLHPEINFQLRVIIEASYRLRIDSAGFERVVSNLIQNSCEAIQALDRQGFVEILMEDLGGQISIQIIDNGCGIPEGIKKNLGQRGVTSGKESLRSGYGLGFSSAMEFITALQGSLEVIQTGELGTSLRILIPKTH